MVKVNCYSLHSIQHFLIGVVMVQVQLDREWYDQEEGGAQVDETHNPFLGDEQLFAKKEAEMQQKMKRRDGSNMTLAQSKRANELQKDMNAWEENRMLTSGVVRMREVSAVLSNGFSPWDKRMCADSNQCWSNACR